MSPAFESLSPNLIVGDVGRSVDFYVEKLGFELVFSVPDQRPYNWAMVQLGPVTMMFQTLPSITEDLPDLRLKAGEISGTFYIKVRNLDALLDSIKQKMALAVELRTTFYGAREFAVRDPDGNVLMFAEDVK